MKWSRLCGADPFGEFSYVTSFGEQLAPRPNRAIAI